MTTMTRRDVIQGLTIAAIAPTFDAKISVAAITRRSHKSKRGVSLYSYQEEFYIRAMTLEDCLAKASSIGGFGIAMLPEQMIPGFPNPSEKRIEDWLPLNEKHRTIPVTYTQFQDTYLTPSHDLTTDEGVQMLEGNLKLAKRLGFRNLRLLTGTPIEVIEEGIPLAEKLDLRMNIEIHAPCPIDGPLGARWIEIIEKRKAKHFGLDPDMGLFLDREERVDRDRRIRDCQVRKQVADFIEKTHEEKVPEDRVAMEVKNQGAMAGELNYLRAVYTPGGQDVEKLRHLVPYSHGVHAKFYEMTEDYEEYGIRYDQIVKVLIEDGYDGYLASEWKGQRITQDAFETDSCEQVRRQHVILDRLLGEV